MPPDSSSSNPIRKTKAVPRKSPFFRPSDHDTPDNIHGGSRFFRTPGGTTRRKKNALRKSSGSDKAEHKSTVLDAVSNLVNAIVGAGIVGIPFAIQESGFVPGICLVIFVALMCEKSLRLLIETAKHSNVPSYETVAEAAFGKLGFYFVATNMFILSYGAMMSYLMIVKDSFSSILGIDEDDVLMKRTVLVVVSSLVILPLSCQRDMADLAKTSKMNVCFDVTMVLIVTYLAFCCGGDEMHEKAYYVDYDVISDSSSGAGSAAFATTADETTNDLFKIQWDTIAIGLGVLSFAFVCQHASFIIAGSLENPTKERWSTVSRLGLGFCAFLALLMGISGNLGFAMNGRHVHGDILNSLPEELALSKVAKGLLGTTMLFVYPMESFVARHACVVVLFEGRKAHEGDDASVLNRRDRRITLTVALYLSAVIPAAIFEELGDVLAITGAIGGSCLSYIGKKE
jgi:sodium-coupled neutral amino acid transporter 11